MLRVFGSLTAGAIGERAASPSRTASGTSRPCALQPDLDTRPCSGRSCHSSEDERPACSGQRQFASSLRATRSKPIRRLEFVAATAAGLGRGRTLPAGASRRGRIDRKSEGELRRLLDAEAVCSGVLGSVSACVTGERDASPILRWTALLSTLSTPAGPRRGNRTWLDRAPRWLRRNARESFRPTRRWGTGPPSMLALLPDEPNWSLRSAPIEDAKSLPAPALRNAARSARVHRGTTVESLVAKHHSLSLRVVSRRARQMRT